MGRQELTQGDEEQRKNWEIRATLVILHVWWSITLHVWRGCLWVTLMAINTGLLAVELL